MKDDIEKCLVSPYRDIEGSGLDVGIVVVDNNSEDGIDKFLQEKYPEIKVIMRDGNFGFGSAQNRGIKSIDAKYYFALNPDTEFPEGQGVVKKMYDFMEDHPKIGMVAPKIVYPDGSLQYSCWRFPKSLQPLYQRTKLGQTKKGQSRVSHHHMKDFKHDETRPVEAIMGSAMFARKETLDEVGLFDERFWMYYEDIDWCLRMWEAGWPVYYLHDIVIKHVHGRGSAKIPGILKALIKNKLARVHLSSWLKFMWKWRKDGKYYK